MFMMPQRQLIVYRLKTNDSKWKEIKRVYDRFETIPLEDWNFLIDWLHNRRRLIKDLELYGMEYKDIIIDS
jgi:hypothetical protein